MHNWNKESVAYGLEIITGCRYELLQELTRLLNEFHCWEKSERYYDIIAGDWLETFIHVTYAAMVEGFASGVSKPLSSPILVSSDIFSYQGFCINDSGLHEHLRDAVVDLLAGGTPAGWKFAANSVQIVSGASSSFVERLLRSVTTSQPSVLIVSPYFKCGRVEVAKTLFGWRNWAALDSLRYPVSINAKLEGQWRLNQALAAYPATEFLSALRVLLPLHLPVALLEGFFAYRNTVLAMPVARPKAVYSANALHGNLTFKILAAEWREEATRLLYHQHGGGYGIDRVHVIEQFESRVAHRYYSWGWVSKENLKVRPLSPAPLLKPFAEKLFILLCLVDYPTKVYRIHFHPMPGTLQVMYKETYEFLLNFTDSRDLLVRPSFLDYSGNFYSLLQKYAPNASFDDHKVSSFVRFAQSRIVVHNYLGTSYLETLALNIPTICFFDPDTYAFRPEAEPFIRLLESVGILHGSGKAAAQFLTSVVNDTAGWWSLPDVQEARRSFVANYANFSFDWKLQWEEEFQREIYEPHCSEV